MVKPIPLYFARSMADLRAQIGVRHNRNQPLTFKRFQKLYKTVKSEAEQCLNVEGDRELAYVAYCNALEYLNQMTKCEEYSQQSETFQTRYEQRRIDCEQHECALRLELEQR
ncbi:unnamed protein product [Rotaria sp. Silwood2]|nr:unnamed protein product [Rotaria sp. Silwood2]CAF2756642.1 unnamed protein product [Rotaria sp. Silwood2]CAF3080270.1 unnamed protein product [Rotaria sp. Silwood2]CAF3171508.1 unnamed protein product [Rotaria sp. Silwood2]CAF4163354.1 unnamed protein product [Rotaria sp. Silwood2]